MQIQCASCQQEMSVPANAAERRLKCPCCGARLVIPEQPPEKPPVEAPKSKKESGATGSAEKSSKIGAPKAESKADGERRARRRKKRREREAAKEAGKEAGKDADKSSPAPESDAEKVAREKARRRRKKRALLKRQAEKARREKQAAEDAVASQVDQEPQEEQPNHEPEQALEQNAAAAEPPAAEPPAAESHAAAPELSEAPEPERASSAASQQAVADERAADVAEDLWRLKTPDGEIYGPAAAEELNEWVEEGRVDASCQLSQGDGPWISASERYPELEIIELDLEGDAAQSDPAPVGTAIEDVSPVASEPVGLGPSAGSSGAHSPPTDPALARSLRTLAAAAKLTAILTFAYAAVLIVLPAVGLWNVLGEETEDRISAITVASIRILLAFFVLVVSWAIWAGASQSRAVAEGNASLQSFAMSLTAAARWAAAALLAAAIWHGLGLL